MSELLAASLLPLLLERLEQARRQRQTLTYRQLLDVLPLPTPGMQHLAGLLEQLGEQDAGRGWPLRSALVISQAGSGLPRSGFFQHLAESGIFEPSASAAAARQWHAQELLRVFNFSYPGDA